MEWLVFVGSVVVGSKPDIGSELKQQGMPAVWIGGAF